MTSELQSRVRWLAPLIGGILLISLLNIGASFWVLKFLEKKAKHPIEGIFAPHPFYPSFKLESPRFNWRGRFEVHSGTFEVRYNPLYLLWHRKFRTQIAGREVGVTIAGELAESGGFSEIKVDWVDADIAFPRKGTLEIFSFNVKSEQMEFSLEREERDLDENPVKTGGQ